MATQGDPTDVPDTDDPVDPPAVPVGRWGLSTEPYRLRLFVTGRSANSLRALHNLRILCERELKSRYELDVVDILEDPQSAEDSRILATPTLLKLWPPPKRIIIGDLSDYEKVLIGLDLPANPNEPSSNTTP